MIRFKSSVVIQYFNRRLARVFEAASIWSELTRIGVDVNAVTDGQHKPGSLHYFSLAVDLDTEGDRRQDLMSLHAWLARHLEAGYDVVFEEDHVHVEYDSHRTTPLTAAGPVR